MKKYLPVLLTLFLICAFLMSCSNVGAAQNEINNSGSKGTFVTSGGNDKENNGTANAGQQGSSDAVGEAGAGNGEPPENPAEDEDVDLDISNLSSVLVYSQVVRILDEPEQYLGKTIRIKGQYYSMFYEPTQQYCHYVVVGDASLCCQVGIEFIWNGNHNHPDDYPAEKKIIEIVGLFSSYEELGETYYALIVDDISVLS